MPIKQQGSKEYGHFRALFDNVLKPAVEKYGYEVTRADDVKKVGAITKDIIVPLAEAQLVIADLTELNPNVFYELGVRHALRGFGTIMIMDETQTAIPFDITAYRVIKFQSTLEGIGSLGKELSAYVQQLEAGPNTARDNLVHDWLPSLPLNVLESSLGSEAGALRAQIQSIQKELKNYQDRYGLLSLPAQSEADPLSVVNDALNEARQGHLPAALVDAATEAADKGDFTEFLDKVSMLLQVRTTKPTPNQLVKLVYAAKHLGLDAVEHAVLDHSLRLHPNNTELRKVRLQTLAHSDDRSSREKGRQEMLQDLGVSYQGGVVEFSKQLTDDDFLMLSILLDTYLEDGLIDDAKTITSALMASHPERSILLRNFARILVREGKKLESYQYYKRALLARDSNDTAAIWFGNALHNAERHIDAAEVYLIACIKDPNDPRGFFHFADDMSWARHEDEASSPSRVRSLPAIYGNCKSVIAAALVAGLSCGFAFTENAERIKNTAKRIDIDIDNLESYCDPTWGVPQDRAGRIVFAKKNLDILRSAITDATQELLE